MCNSGQTNESVLRALDIFSNDNNDLKPNIIQTHLFYINLLYLMISAWTPVVNVKNVI